MASDTDRTFCRRNEHVSGNVKTTVNRQPGAVTVVGDDPKKFAAAMVEYSKVRDAGDPGPVAGAETSGVSGKGGE